MDMSLSALRASLQAGAPGGDARPYSTAHHSNNSGAADEQHSAQMTDLAKQLNAQMEYNNSLLEQIQRLEECQLAQQRSSSDKQASLRQAMQVAEAARGEAADLRRKLAVAQVRWARARAAPSRGVRRSCTALARR